MRSTPLALPVLLLALGAPARAADPTPEDVKFFEARIRPLLVEKCFKCHGPEKQKGDLRLDSAAALAKGGGSGTPLFAKDKPDEGLLLRAVRHADGVEQMPPDKKLTDAEIADLAKWAARGAFFPAAAGTATADPTKHWAFQPVAAPAPPAVTNAAWPRSDLDRFVLAKLEAAGLKPAPPADKRTLIRRATFDLTGLPPTPEEIDAFLKDSAPGAFETVIDRLLASPHYGERWGRHWLDVARYADSNGLDENIAHGNAWRYRDYVIASFNADKPYDRFLREQVAGDLLPADTPAARNEQLIATGFLALGPKVLAEPDEKKMELDIVDEQLDTLGRTVMGLTIGCARCHDHKFDPITLADYYALAGVFAGTKTMEHFRKVARWHENPLTAPEEAKRKAEHDAKVAKRKGELKALGGKPDETSKQTAKKLQDEIAALEKAAPELPSAMGTTEGTPVDVPLLRRGNHLTPGPVVARRFPVVLAGEKQPPLPKTQSGRLELANWLTDPKHPLTARVMVNRVWRWHFGKGLVRSADNFGLIGEKPTHPELLDRLAADFVRNGWSVKALHKQLMLSATYQMSAAHDPKAVTADPDNRLLWRANVKRLEAEAVRDALLAVGGQLDRSAGGPVLAHVKNRDFLFDHTSKDQTTYTSPRRSVYLPVVRNNLYDVFQLFDAPDAAVPNGDRATTTVPTQALFFMNSDLATRAADALAGRVLAGPERGATERVGLLFALAYGRPPSEKEVQRVTAGVAALEREFASEADPAKRTRKAWAAVCQAVLAANEFIHIP
ncbi:PSD1 and planctomycete cytochrome C domain-containing protein [Gemmata sp. JC717]|uniref:PSD1 and planctomycete cytochrome C domain-containing protein n=1 Tax=Gemmata algarum TaxID=2975278 RepID=UPI0021BBAE05|nr:PSD1 and planctomycete cytochrome C domain-containing protein [Gemmata algarum]MDY3553888.1 PSD1 and planctomycete cytochrome C domain-containing protein [Gemmata algarum]